MTVNKPLSSRSLIGTILILAPLIVTFAFALDIYVPSIPDIMNVFHTDQDVMQLTISLYLLMTGLGQLTAGPISDQFGRRKVVLWSAAIFTLGCVVCSISPTIEILILGRLLQAIGACGMFVAAFAIVRDIFSGDEVATVYSFLNSTISLSPLFAPLIGGYLEYWISWRASFIFLAILGALVVLLSYKTINETLHEEYRRPVRKEIFRDYLRLLKNKYFISYTFCAAAGFASFLVFFSSSSYIIIDLLGVPEEHFGFYFATIGIMFFIGSLLSGYTVKIIGTYRTALIGTLFILVSGLLMFYWYYRWGLSMSGFMVPMAVMSIGGAFTMGASAGGAIEPFPEMAGTAAALFGSCEFLFAFIVSQFVLLWPVRSTLPLSYTLITLGALSFVTIVINHRK